MVGPLIAAVYGRGRHVMTGTQGVTAVVRGLVLCPLLLAVTHCGVDPPARPSSSMPLPTPSPTPAPLPLSGLQRLTIALDPGCADTFPASRRERAYTIRFSATPSHEKIPAFVGSRMFYLIGTLSTGYRPLVVVDYTPPNATFMLTMGEYVTDHEMLQVYGQALLAPLLPKPACGSFSGTVNLFYTNNLELSYSCTSQTHRLCLNDAN